MRWASESAFTYTGHSRGDVITGLVWLSLGAAVSVMLETIYLSTWVTLADGLSFPFPYPIFLAYLFNAVLTRTAALWSPRVWVALVPLAVWLVGYFVMAIVGLPDGSVILGANLRSLFLLGAGIAGGIRPVAALK